MLLYWLWYALLEDLSLRQKLTLLERYSDPEELYTSLSAAAEPEYSLDLTRAQTVMNICRRKGIGILPMGDSAYPRRLRNISDPPLVLYYRGVLPDFEAQPCIGVVGTRKATPYGANTAKQLSAQLAVCGGLVVSGAAAGIDTQGLLGALETGAPAVAVLGCGVDVVYPRNNRPLFMKLEQQGCLLSEYLPGTEPKPWQFPERNRIISGISNGVLVVEAPEKSGALITARDAMEQGKDVFAVPGNIDIATCSGSNGLLQEGAYAVFSGWDMLKHYEAQYPHRVRRKQITAEPAEAKNPVTFDKKDIDRTEKPPYSVKETNDSRLTEQENEILSYLQRMPQPVDAVIAKAQQPAPTVLRVLTKLSLMGLVINHPGKMVSRK